MSDQTNVDVDAATVPAPTDQPTPTASTDPRPEAPKPTETVDFWKQKAREQEQRAKSNADAARRLQEFEDSQKSEAQRQAEATARAQREAAEARSETLRYKAAAVHGIAPDYFDLLGSGDEETINARAERIGGLLKTSSEIATLRAELDALKAGRPVPGRPTEQLKPGATPEQVSGEDALYAQFFPPGQ
jgi:multidrug efflux pump subunit AcrA (membrane-fusion protein)